MKELLKSLDGYAASRVMPLWPQRPSLRDGCRQLPEQGLSELQAMRLRADKEMALQVDKLNGLLAKFEEANNEVKAQTAIGGDPSDALDQRETLLKDISSIIGINVVNRPNNDVALYTTDGHALRNRAAQGDVQRPAGLRRDDHRQCHLRRWRCAQGRHRCQHHGRRLASGPDAGP